MTVNSTVNWTGIRRRITTTTAIAAVACSALIVTGSASAGTATETDVMAWLDAVDPAITVDQSANCMAGATDAVAYRNDRIVLRTNAANATAANVVNAKLNQMYGTTGVPYTGAVERITFPNTPPANTPVTPVLSITLTPRPGGLPHDILGLAQRLRHESMQSLPPTARAPSGTCSHYWPNGYRPRSAHAQTTNPDSRARARSAPVRRWRSTTPASPRRRRRTTDHVAVDSNDNNCSTSWQRERWPTIARRTARQCLVSPTLVPGATIKK
jgi:hypothetical protein